MAKFSQKSASKLSECDPRLQEVFNEVIKEFDCTVLTGHRPKDEQEKMVALGRSKVHFPHSRHNRMPSLAVDVAPYPVDWNDRERFHLFAGYVLGIARSKGIKLRWGGDWDQDTEVDDNSFDDLPHFELVQ